MENIPMEEKVSIAALQLEGEALVERFGADSPKKLVSFEISNLSHFYPQETSNNESDVEAFENMHLGWIFLNDESDMDTKSLDSDGKEVLSWQACFDLIVFKIMTSCDLWFDFESDMKTLAKIWPWEEIEKSVVLLTEEGTEVWV
ncbi:hypothetical protein KY289_031133 [Solanum tuberosum]|nr:hypothetical protein KY284_030807 [Solanum tuberosum]KAH0653455.1 hypothetical protein KY289_031133 [Solanum tuberosum]